MKAGNLKEAENCLTGVLARGGKASFVYSNLGIVYQLQQEHERAIRQFQEAIRLEPGYLAPRVLLGASLLAVGKLPEATQHLETATRLEPNNVPAREQLARTYQQAGNLIGLVDQYRGLRVLKPEELEYAFQLGRAYVKLSAWCHKEILNQDPNSARAFQSLAENNMALGHTDKAVRYYQRAVEAAPNLPENHLALALIYLQQGKLPDAGREVDVELSIVPYSAAAIELKKKIETLAAASPQQ